MTGAADKCPQTIQKDIMPNYIQTLQEENKVMKEELEKLKSQPKAEEQPVSKDRYANLTDEQDGRDDLVDILYRNPNAAKDAVGGNKFVIESITLQKGFDKLVQFYSSFPRLTDRNIPKDYWDGTKPVTCNQCVCYIRNSYTDKTSGQKIENLRKEVPLWLAVDMAVQQDHKIELISRKEYEDFQDDLIREELRRDKVFIERKRAQILEKMLKEEELMKEETINS